MKEVLQRFFHFFERLKLVTGVCFLHWDKSPVQKAEMVQDFHQNLRDIRGTLNFADIWGLEVCQNLGLESGRHLVVEGWKLADTSNLEGWKVADKSYTTPNKQKIVHSFMLLDVWLKLCSKLDNIKPQLKPNFISILSLNLISSFNLTLRLKLHQHINLI